jgi:thiosulfate reductase cytochrome b subunit
MFYRYPQRYEVVTLKIGGLAWIAAAHVLGSFLLVAFVVAHVYLTTTGESLLSNLKAMITGYEDVPPSGEIQVGRR